MEPTVIRVLSNLIRSPARHHVTSCASASVVSSPSLTLRLHSSPLTCVGVTQHRSVVTWRLHVQPLISASRNHHGFPSQQQQRLLKTCLLPLSSSSSTVSFGRGVRKLRIGPDGVGGGAALTTAAAAGAGAASGMGTIERTSSDKNHGSLLQLAAAQGSIASAFLHDDAFGATAGHASRRRLGVGGAGSSSSLLTRFT